MATNSVKGANVTKFDTPGGDNIISDGYVKAVEKVWLDNYTLTSNITLTNTTISIATLPKNKKITDIVVMIETTASQTNGTLAMGFTTDADGSTWGSLMSPATITHNETVSCIRLCPSSPLDGVVDYDANFYGKLSAFQKVTSGTQVTIAVKLNNWTATTGTVKSIVRYT